MEFTYRFTLVIEVHQLAQEDIDKYAEVICVEILRGRFRSEQNI